MSTITLMERGAKAPALNTSLRRKDAFPAGSLLGGLARAAARVWAAIEVANMRRVEPAVRAALKRASDAELEALGHTREEIARLRALPDLPQQHFVI